MIYNEKYDRRTIHKVYITKEAAFDCERIGVEPDKADVKEQFEQYLYIKQPTFVYFKCRYYDENGKTRLMCFFRRAELFGNMQNWRLVGICEEGDYSAELEERGLIKNWLDSRLVEDA